MGQMLLPRQQEAVAEMKGRLPKKEPPLSLKTSGRRSSRW